MIKEKPVCTQCGSDDVKADAWAVWDYEEQEWVLDNAFDNNFCEFCEDSCKLNWIKEEIKSD